ncbi:uncharacterized protein LOC144432162 isoform X2 [Styela clava]
MPLLRPRRSHISKDRTLKNVKNLETLKQINPDKCGRELCLSHVPCNYFNKLKAVIGHSKIDKISLRSCFDDPFQTLEILQSMKKNDCLFKVHLDLLDNVHNDACIDTIMELVTHGVVNSIEVPKRLNENNSERLLSGILNSQREIKTLNLNDSTLNGKSIEHLQEMLEKGRIFEDLNMSNCHGVLKSHLTTKDKENLKKALKSGQKKFDERIIWGFNRATGRKEKQVIQFVVRKGLDSWQQYKSRGKRKKQSNNTDTKRAGMDEDMVESISKKLACQNVSGKHEKTKKNKKGFIPGFWSKKNKASQFSNPLMETFNESKETVSVLEQQEGEIRSSSTTPTSSGTIRQNKIDFRSPNKYSQFVAAEVHQEPEECEMACNSGESCLPQDCKAAPSEIQYGARREQELPSSASHGQRARARSSFGSEYQFDYADEQPDHQVQEDVVQPVSRTSLIPEFVDLGIERNQRRSHRSLSCSIEPQRNERSVNPRQGASSRGRGGRRNQVSGNNTMSRRSAGAALPQNQRRQGPGNNQNNNTTRPMTRGCYSQDILTDVMRQAQRNNGARVVIINDNRTVNASNVLMENSRMEMRDQNRPNVINNRPQQVPAEDQMEHDADDQGNPRIHCQPAENLRHPEDEDASDEDNFEDARENL